MFQPAEEDGSGARAVVADPKFTSIRPDWAFAIHNEPGLPFGYVGIKPGLINCASRGLAISLKGRTSHAAEPRTRLLAGFGTAGNAERTRQPRYRR